MVVDKTGVHTSHCCKVHGCKFGDPECPVVEKGVAQEFLCDGCPPWTLTWPTKEGLYWFFGHKYKAAPSYERPPEIYFVRVNQAGGTTNPHLMVVCEGAFMYKGEGASGFWLPVRLPDLPALPVPLGERK